MRCKDPAFHPLFKLLKYIILPCLILSIISYQPSVIIEVNYQPPVILGTQAEMKKITEEVFGKKFLSVIKCESGFRHYTSSGKVLVSPKNTNGTYDIGTYQINSRYLSQAKKMGIDLYTPEGNLAFAKYLYFDTKQGINHWVCARGIKTT